MFVFSVGVESGKGTEGGRPLKWELLYEEDTFHNLQLPRLRHALKKKLQMMTIWQTKEGLQRNFFSGHCGVGMVVGVVVVVVVEIEIVRSCFQSSGKEALLFLTILLIMEKRFFVWALKTTYNAELTSWY